MEPKNEKTTCIACGVLFDYEPIWIGSYDLGKSLATHCEDCHRELERKARETAKAAEVAGNVARIIEIIPPQLLPEWLDPQGTDLKHPDFNRRKWAEVNRWRPGPQGGWLGLIGGAGMCKTRCLALMAEKIMMQGHRLHWTSAMRLFLEATVNLRSRDRVLMTTAREHLSKCMSAAFLVIDDLGNNEWSPAFESQLFTILDHRKNYRLPILYSSNVHPSQFSQVITSVNPAALIGRLTDRVTLCDFTHEDTLL